MWKHRIILVFKQEKVWQIVVEIKAKPIIFARTYISEGTFVLPTTWANNIND